MGLEEGILALDIDDVLFKSAAGFADFSNKQWDQEIVSKWRSWCSGLVMVGAWTAVREHFDAQG